MTKAIKFIGVFFLLYLVVFSGFAQSAKGLLQINGENLKTIDLSASDFAALKRISIQSKGHDGKKHTYSGVLLADILSRAGLFSAESKVKTIRTHLVAKAADNYQTIFALAEIDPAFSSTKIILADQVDGKALPATNGPLQIIVPGDKKHGRWVRQVHTLTLVMLP